MAKFSGLRIIPPGYRLAEEEGKTYLRRRPRRYKLSRRAKAKMKAKNEFNLNNVIAAGVTMALVNKFAPKFIKGDFRGGMNDLSNWFKPGRTTEKTEERHYENPLQIASKQHLVDPRYPNCETCNTIPQKFIWDLKIDRIICPVCGGIKK